MDITLAAVCDTARERADGKLDLIGIFNELRAPGFPAIQERMTVVLTVAWTAEEAGRQPIRADLIDESEELVLTIQGHTEVPETEDADARPQTRLVMPLENVVFPHHGRYWLRLTAGGTAVRTCSLYVGAVEEAA